MERDPTVDKDKLNENCRSNFSQTLKHNRLDPWNDKERQKSRSAVYASTERINPRAALLDKNICENNLDYIGIKAKVDTNLGKNVNN